MAKIRQAPQGGRTPVSAWSGRGAMPQAMSGYGRPESSGTPVQGQYAFKVKGTADWDGPSGISPPIRKE